jgi:hypothetical protein
MWRVQHLFVPALVVGAGIALSACGGDSSPETPIVVPTETQPAQGKAQFIAQADSVCADANSSIEQFAAAGQGETEADQIAQLRQGVIDQMKQLDPPAEDSATLDQFLSAMSDQVSAGQKIGLAVQRGEDPTEFETDLDNAKSQAETAASSYGFQECGQPISSSGTSTPSSSSSSSSSSGGTVAPSAPSSSPSTPPSGGVTGGGTSGGSTGGGGTTGGGTTGGGGGSTGGGTGGSNSGGISPG